MRVRSIVLIGLPGSGKSTVGRLLAEALGWRFLDVDRMIERQTGRSITDIFRAQGEAAFRRLEAEAAHAALEARDAVVAPGGGWAAAPGSLESLAPDALSVWLKVSPGVALTRMGHAHDRPLLADDPAAGLERLHRQRSARYADAALTVETDGRTVDEVVETILKAATHQ